MQWTARADWIDAEDGTVVCLRPHPHDLTKLPQSMALWPERRALIAAAPQMYEALKALLADTQHSTHACPVAMARVAIAAAEVRS